MDTAAQRFGLSRNQFLIHLLLSWRDFKTLDPVERVFLMHLTFWGVLNFKDNRPNLQRFAGTAMITEDGVRGLVDKFVSRGWMEKRTTNLGKRFNYDLSIDGEVYGLTDAGLRIAGFAR